MNRLVDVVERKLGVRGEKEGGKERCFTLFNRPKKKRGWK